MTSGLDPESRKDLIKYRLDRAFETLKEADYNATPPVHHMVVTP